MREMYIMWTYILNRWYWTFPLFLLVLFLILNAILFLLSIIIWKLRPAIFVKDGNLPAKALRGKHNDWWFFIKWVPRSWNSFLNGDKKHQWPKIILGNNKRMIKMWTSGGVFLYKIINTRVPNPGTWNLCIPFMLAITTKKFRYFRWGICKDYFGDNPNPIDGDDYWTIGGAFKKIDFTE